MHEHARFALAHPVFDPDVEIVPGHFWLDERSKISVGLTVNIGME
jgi:hypothetical protein